MFAALIHTRTTQLTSAFCSRLWHTRANDKIPSSVSCSLVGMQLPACFNEEAGRRKSCPLCSLWKISFTRQNGRRIKNRGINVEHRTDGRTDGFERNVTVCAEFRHYAEGVPKKLRQSTPAPCETGKIQIVHIVSSLTVIQPAYLYRCIKYVTVKPQILFT